MVELRPAPFSRRLLAVLVGRALGVAVGVGALVAGFAMSGVYYRLRGDEETPGAEKERSGAKFELSAAQRLALWAAGTGVGIWTRTRRGLAFRTLGLRRVDARTGGPVSVRSVVVGAVFDSAWRAATKPLFDSGARRARQRLAVLQPQIKQIERQYASEAEQRRQALMAFYETNKVNPLAGCGRRLLAAGLWSVMFGVLSWHGRNLFDYVTGTVIVADGDVGRTAC